MEIVSGKNKKKIKELSAKNLDKAITQMKSADAFALFCVDNKKRIVSRVVTGSLVDIKRMVGPLMETSLKYKLIRPIP
jgi:hypothetical protein